MEKQYQVCRNGRAGGRGQWLFRCGRRLFLVPLLVSWCGMEQRRAFATSVAVILPLSAVSAAIYWMKGGLDVAAAWPYLLGGAVGGVIAGRIFSRK